MFLQRLVLLHPSHRLHLGQRALPGSTFPLVYVQNGCLSWIKTKYQPCAGNLSQWISGENVLWSVCQQTINTSLPFHNSSVYMWQQNFLRNCNTLCIELNPWIMQKHCTQIYHCSVWKSWFIIWLQVVRGRCPVSLTRWCLFCSSSWRNDWPEQTGLTQDLPLGLQSNWNERLLRGDYEKQLQEQEDSQHSCCLAVHLWPWA